MKILHKEMEKIVDICIEYGIEIQFTNNINAGVFTQVAGGKCLIIQVPIIMNNTNISVFYHELGHYVDLILNKNESKILRKEQRKGRVGVNILDCEVRANNNAMEMYSDIALIICISAL